MSFINRRKFIGLSLSAVGGVMLTGCGVDLSGNGGSSNAPNGYSFYVLKSNDGTVSDASFRISKFYGSASISDGIVTFDAVDSSKRKGIFQLGINFEGPSPKIDWERTAVVKGEVLDDNRKVSDIRSYDVDGNGSIAAVIEADISHSEDHYGAGLYLEQLQGGFSPVLLAGQTFNSDGMMSTGIFGDVSYNNDSLIVSAHQKPTETGTERHKDCLLHIPTSAPASAEVILSAGSVVPGTSSIASSFGLIDHNIYGDYSAGVFIGSSSAEAAAQTDFSRTMKIGGSLYAAKDVKARAVSLDADDISSTLLESHISYGSRVALNGDVYDIVSSGEQTYLLKNGSVILSTGDLLGNRETFSIYTGSAGDDGLFYFVTTNRLQGVVHNTLYAYDGSVFSEILSTEDRLSTRLTVERILFGTSTSHVDSEGRMVFFCSFSNGTTSMVLGVPA